MAQPVTVFRWDDAGAPQLPNGKPSEIIDILTKCLVDGYGDKTPIGWTRPFYDAGTQAAAFRNSVAAGGSGGYAKIFSNDGSDSNHALMRTTHAASMTDISTLFRQGFTQAFQAKSGTTTSKMDKWVLVGTATAFYFIIVSNVPGMNGGYGVNIFAGDLYTLLPNDAGRFVTVTGNAGDSSSTISTQSLEYLLVQPSSSAQHIKVYDVDGYDNSHSYALNYLFGAANMTTTVASGRPTHPELLYPVYAVTSGGVPGSTNNNLDRLGNHKDYSDLSPSIRGVFPGLYVNQWIGYKDGVWPIVTSLTDDDYLILRASGSSTGCRGHLKLGTWHDPFNPV